MITCFRGTSQINIVKLHLSCEAVFIAIRTF